MKKKIASLFTILVLSLSFVPVFTVNAAPATIDPLGPMNDILEAGGTMIDIAGTVATSQSEIAANTSERRFYDTLTAMANSGNGVFAARSGGAANRTIIDASTNTINYIDTSTNQYVSNNYTDIYYNSTYNTYYAVTNDYDYYISYSPTYTYVTYVGTTAEWDSRQTVYYFYELPDGRNSYNLSASDVFGQVFDYNVLNYDVVPEDDGVTLGLYHFDGNTLDSSAAQNHIIWNEGASVTYLDSNAFNACLYLDNSAHSFTVPADIGQDDFTLEFRLYVSPITTGHVDYRITTEPYVYFYEINSNGSHGYYVASSSSWAPADYTIQYTVSDSFIIAPSSKDLLFFKDNQLLKLDHFGFLDDYSAGRRDCYLISVLPDFSVYKPSGKLFNYFSFGHLFDSFNSVPATMLDITLDFNGICYTGSYTQYRSDYSSDSCSLSYLSGDSFNKFPVGQWVSCSVVRENGVLKQYINGVLVSSEDNSDSIAEFTFDMPLDSFQYCYLDELRISSKALYSGANYNVPTQPFDTNEVLVLPEKLENKSVYIQSGIEVENYRIGGVRPTFPVKGDVFIGLNNNWIVEAAQQYDGTQWVSVNGSVRYDDVTYPLIGYDFSETVVDPDDYPGFDDDDLPGGDGGNPGGGDTGSGEGGSDTDGSIFDILKNGIFALFDGISGIVGSLTSVGSGFVGFLGAAMPFIPKEIISILIAGVGVTVVLLILKIIRG